MAGSVGLIFWLAWIGLVALVARGSGLVVSPARIASGCRPEPPLDPLVLALGCVLAGVPWAYGTLCAWERLIPHPL